MKKVILIVLVGMLGLIGCLEGTAEEKDRAAVQEQQSQYQISQPIPRFDWSLERNIAIQLYQARNEEVNTWTVWRSDLGTIEGHCASVGYPIPYDTSLTNPLQKEWGSQGGSVAIEQPEPNGLYSSKNSIATWVRCLCEVNGEFLEVPVYIESKVTAYPFPVNVNYDKNRVNIVSGGVPSVTIKNK